jgi:hypothetical protein
VWASHQLDPQRVKPAGAASAIPAASAGVRASARASEPTEPASEASTGAPVSEQVVTGHVPLSSALASPVAASLPEAASELEHGSDGHVVAASALASGSVLPFVPQANAHAALTVTASAPA